MNSVWWKPAAAPPPPWPAVRTGSTILATPARTAGRSRTCWIPARSNRLSAAVVGSSSLAEDASHLALGTRFFDLVEDGRFDDTPLNVTTIGEALLVSKRALIQSAPEHASSVYSITLFGDPAMPLR